MPWYCLACALLLLGYARSLAPLLFALLLGIFFFFGFVDVVGVVLLIAFFLLAFLYSSKPLIELIVLLFVLGLFLHLIPGFANPKILDQVLVSEQSAPFSMYFNFDKALTPFFLLMLLPSLFMQKSQQKIRPLYWIILIGCPFLLLFVAKLLGLLLFEFHIPIWIWSFMLSNLFFVSLAEEALFRGYLQQRLAPKIGEIEALLLSGALFGAFHYAGGIALVIFATLAGVIYGLAWMWSKRLWVSVAFHFGLNCLHLIFFTYPIYLPPSLPLS